MKGLTTHRNYPQASAVRRIKGYLSQKKLPWIPLFTWLAEGSVAPWLKNTPADGHNLYCAALTRAGSSVAKLRCGTARNGEGHSRDSTRQLFGLTQIY